MASYIIKKEILIQRQEGDVGDVVFIIPSAIPLPGCQVKFGVFTQNNEQIFLKETDDVSINGQELRIELESEDTKGHAGVHVWELELTPAGSGPITVGRGDFKIIREWIR